MLGDFERLSLAKRFDRNSKKNLGGPLKGFDFVEKVDKVVGRACDQRLDQLPGTSAFAIHELSANRHRGRPLDRLGNLRRCDRKMRNQREIGISLSRTESIPTGKDSRQ